jgi:hypothetical protein
MLKKHVTILIRDRDLCVEKRRKSRDVEVVARNLKRVIASKKRMI